jgi:hypothetical protein
MKKLLILALCAIFALAIVIGCGEKKADDADMTAGGHAEEMADTTRMDSAAMDSMGQMMTDSANMMTDSAGGAMEGETGGH